MGVLRKQLQMLLTFPQNLTLQQAFENAAQIKEELKRMEVMVHFAKKNHTPSQQIFFI